MAAVTAAAAVNNAGQRGGSVQKKPDAQLLTDSGLPEYQEAPPTLT